MDKKYQVFVSSTYEDLKEVRSAVITTLLKAGFMPTGMEYFTATSKTQWEVIEKIIPQCDYYVVIVAGKYGSIEPVSGISYTEKEYDLAVSSGVPAMGFLYKDIENLKFKQVESEEGRKNKLKQFHEKIKSRMSDFWTNKDELATKVLASLHNEVVRNPRVGWVRANEVKCEANPILTSAELELRDKKTIAKLMSCFSTGLMDEYLREGPTYVNADLLTSFDMCEATVRASSFILYGETIRSLWKAFYDRWYEAMCHYEWYSSSNNNRYRFEGLRGDRFITSTDEDNFNLLVDNCIKLHSCYMDFINFVKGTWMMNVEESSVAFEEELYKQKAMFKKD
jgi:hypothetical protein